MRHALITTTFALTAALGSVGLYAQPAVAAGGSDAQQSYMIAQNSSNSGPNLFKLFQQIQRLQAQVRDLQGQVDTLKYRLKQNEQGQRDLYQNLDKRLSKLEGGGGQTSGQNSKNEQDSRAQASSDVKAAYMDGFNKLKKGQYDAAIASFKSFIDDNPETSLTDNAWYWLGEAYYVQQNLGASQKAFDKVVNRFANSSKVPASLYKIGLIQAANGKNDNAKATFDRIVKQYPQSDSAGLAKNKLQSLGG